MTIILGYKKDDTIYAGCDSLTYNTYTDGTMNYKGCDVHKFFKGKDYFLGVSGYMNITWALQKHLPKSFDLKGLNTQERKLRWVEDVLRPQISDIVSTKTDFRVDGQIIFISKLGVATFELNEYYRTFAVEPFGAVGAGQSECLVALHSLHAANVLQTNPEKAFKIALAVTNKFNEMCKAPINIQSMRVK